MNEPIRTQWQIRCAFNGFCKLALKREAMNAHRDTKQRQLREVTFSDLLMLSRLVDTFFSRTSWTMLLYAENHSISVA